eukprot:scaffold252630_cov18-Prasinocladus_malaysianus.AAC.1
MPQLDDIYMAAAITNSTSQLEVAKAERTLSFPSNSHAKEFIPLESFVFHPLQPHLPHGPLLQIDTAATTKDQASQLE